MEVHLVIFAAVFETASFEACFRHAAAAGTGGIQFCHAKHGFEPVFARLRKGRI